MDPIFFSSPFNTPVANIDNWGNVTDNFGHSLGHADRYGNFQSNLNPFSNNIDSFGTVSTGLNGLGTPLLKLNHYSDYQSCQNRRNAMDDLYLKESRDWYNKRNESLFEKNTFKIPVWEPINFNLSQKVNDFDLPIIEPFKPLSIFKNTNLRLDNFLDKKRYW